MRSDCTEALLPELGAYLETVPGLGQVLRSPLVYAVPYAPELAAWLNDSYLAKTGMIDQAISRRNWDRAIHLHERPYRLQAFCELADHMSDEEYWSLAASVYVGTENADELYVTWREVVQVARGGREHFMLPDERVAFQRLPDVITVYRGCSGSEIRDLSWTLSRDVAEWFANRFGAGGYVLAGTVAKHDALGYLTRRGEEEIAILPEFVSDIRPA